MNIFSKKYVLMEKIIYDDNEMKREEIDQ